MERGRVVQADLLAQVGKADPVAVARDLLQDCEGASERLHADALAVLGLVVDVGLRGHQPGDLRLVGAGRFSAAFAFVLVLTQPPGRLATSVANFRHRSRRRQ